ncbi:hypothetical protein V2J09_023294 [Rumex salicifolius]
MESTNRYSVIIVGAGISAAKTLSENGVEDFVILEASDRIGGRILKEDFGGVSVELGAGWIAGVGGPKSNPVWDLAADCGLRTFFSDYSDARYNIYDGFGKIFPSGEAADSYNKAVESAILKLGSGIGCSTGESLTDSRTPIELAIDFILHDFEMAEVEPISTFTEYGEREFLVADERGYVHLLQNMAETFLTNSGGEILDTRLKLNKVVCDVQQSKSGIVVSTEDGFMYEADYIILSASIGVLQSDLISFRPALPRWKTEAIEKCDVMVYTKIFLKFPSCFWPCGQGKEFFIYAHERRGFYTFWQHMENAYPGSNILVVTLTNEESKRVESQSDQETLKEAMEVLRNMFGPNIPEALDILVPRWWNNRFQRGSYSNYPIYPDQQLVNDIEAPVGRIFFTGEHTSERFNGYVHGGYLAGIDTGRSLLSEMKMKDGRQRNPGTQKLMMDPLLAFSSSLNSPRKVLVEEAKKLQIERERKRGKFNSMSIPQKMLVQERSNPNPEAPLTDKSEGIQHPKPHFPPHNFPSSKSKSGLNSLGSSTCLSLNPLKVTAFFLLFLTFAAFLFLLPAADPSSLFCFRLNSKSKISIEIQNPRIDFKSIAPIKDTSSPYASFRSDQWIVVSVSEHPTDSIRSLARIRGWQVLAVGNSETPPDWSLKGTIYLSLEDQSKLGFRINQYLPSDSYVRKSVGYLFAIQHGAKRIFDADDRGVVIDGNLAKHFDVKLEKYRKNDPNRTVVNPYIHFGQRSVWPRGLPLENVGQIWHEEFYGEILGGKQYIQQGISNGLPDVDSVFYFTRKLTSETFDVRFDDRSPKVAVPQGLMVPLNSFNTIFHSNAFWGLMLPVSVSSMASDVLRGYWAQRMLWEIGGFVVVYPPTVHREDKVGSYRFSEEKDLHVNVGRLIKFLSPWRSSKGMLFEQILQLSFEMAKNNFWTETDLDLTVAWLQDLIAVGYKPPRVSASHSAAQAERREFVPSKLPSMHLAVDESSTVNYEIGKFVRWRKNFGNTVLIMFMRGSVERTALEWRLLYGRLFKTVVILSEQAHPDLSVEQAHLGDIYKHLPGIFQRFPSADGFMFLQDNTVLNYWNLLQADRSKLWITNKVSKSWTVVTAKKTDSPWHSKQADKVMKVVNIMPVHLQVNFKDSSPKDQSIVTCSSEVFYIPQRFVGDFIDLVELVGNSKIHYTVAVPLFFMSMDSPNNYDPILSTAIYSNGLLSPDSSNLQI